MNKNNLIHESDEGYIVFDENKAWFYFFNKDESLVNPVQPICLYRPGNFDLTADEIGSAHGKGGVYEFSPAVHLREERQHRERVGQSDKEADDGRLVDTEN